MSSESLSTPHRVRRYGWWIAGGIGAAAVLALGYAAVVHLAAPAKFAYGLISGNPSIPNCNTTVAREATAGPLWYRLVDVTCGNETMHFVYARQGTGPGWFVAPAFMSAVSPVPVSARQTGDNVFEIVLAQPLADGRASLPLEFDRNGVIKEAQFFDHGRKQAKSPPLGE
jgi:hypothetical protein